MGFKTKNRGKEVTKKISRADPQEKLWKGRGGGACVCMYVCMYVWGNGAGAMSKQK